MPTSPTRHTPVHSIRLGRAVALAACVAVVPAGIVALQAAGAASSHSAVARVISSAENAKFGRILVSGRTVYTLRPSGVACHATCLKYWPEVLLPKGVAHATAGAGVDAAKLGTLTRAGGARQVTYAGKPLYWFSLDTAPGQVKGVLSDTWGRWSVVVVKPKSGSGTTTTTKPATTTTGPGPTTTVKATTTTAPSGGGGGGGAGF